VPHPDGPPRDGWLRRGLGGHKEWIHVHHVAQATFHDFARDSGSREEDCQYEFGDGRVLLQMLRCDQQLLRFIEFPQLKMTKRLAKGGQKLALLAVE
jgi:hypothetical protein